MNCDVIRILFSCPFRAPEWDTSYNPRRCLGLSNVGLSARLNRQAFYYSFIYNETDSALKGQLTISQGKALGYKTYLIRLSVWLNLQAFYYSFIYNETDSALKGQLTISQGSALGFKTYPILSFFY